MKVTIEIPSEFVSHYKDDKFKDSFKRCIFDLKDHKVLCLCKVTKKEEKE